jgi:hypothetical protein
MKSHRKLKATRARPGFVREDWHRRVEPAFLHYWSEKKKTHCWASVEHWNQPERKTARRGSDMAAASRELDKAAARLDSSVWGLLQSAILKPLDIELKPKDRQQSSSGSDNEAIVYPQNPESSAVFRKFVFLKDGITFRELIRRVDIRKDPDAHRKLMAVHNDYWQVQTGAGFRDLRLKFSWDHFDIIASGLDFGFGRLDHYEMAECLDEMCPCGQPKHSAEYIKKLRTQIKKLWRSIQATGEGSSLGARYPL